MNHFNTFGHELRRIKKEHKWVFYSSNDNINKQMIVSMMALFQNLLYEDSTKGAPYPTDKLKKIWEAALHLSIFPIQTILYRS